MIKKILTAVTILLMIGHFQFLYAQTTIIMQKENGVFTVPCTVNGLKFKFIFDTGASDVSISATEALFMLKNGYMNKSDILDKGVYQDANGNLSVGTRIILRKIEFAGLQLNNVQASVVNNLSAPLLLGQSAMAKLGKFQFDPSNGQLTILNGSSQAISNPRFKVGEVNNPQYITANKQDAKTAMGAPSFDGENEFDYIGSLNEGLAYVRKNGLYGFINSKGQIVIPVKYSQAFCFLNGVAEVMENANGTIVSYFIDRSGNKTNRTY